MSNLDIKKESVYNQNSKVPIEGNYYVYNSNNNRYKNNFQNPNSSSSKGDTINYHDNNNSQNSNNNNYNNVVALNFQNRESKKNSKNEMDHKDKEFSELDEIERELRLGFIRKVYGVLTIQLFITFGCVCLSFVKSIRTFVTDNVLIFLIAAGVAIILLIVLVCNRKVALKVPANYIILSIWTLCEAYMLLYVSSYFDWEIVICAIGLVAVLSVALTIYACVTKKDFSFCLSFLLSLLFVGCFYFGFGFWFSKWIYCLFCVLGVMLFSVYLIYDTKRILGLVGTMYTIDDYVSAALNLYIDITQLFVNILILLGIVGH